ncbi:MAG: hypothetical protein EOM04_02580 [Clostridia bacterium]|nr:hypothetical protein [Clostridia bacterium]
MKKVDRKIIIVIFFLIFLFAPINEGYRYFFLAAVPLFIAISNIVVIRNQLFLNEDSPKYQLLEENYGTKKAFLIFGIMLILIPIILGVLFIISGLKLL